jgi:hypothetical protein
MPASDGNTSPAISPEPAYLQAIPAKPTGDSNPDPIIASVSGDAPRLSRPVPSVFWPLQGTLRA